MRKSIKKAMALTLTAAMALSLSACSGGNGSGGSSGGSGSGDSGNGGKVELKFSWWGGDSRHEATEKAIQAFMAKYPDITVTAETGAWSGWEEKQALNIM